MKKFFGLLCSLLFLFSVTAGVASTCKADAKQHVENVKKCEVGSVEVGNEFGVGNLEVGNEFGVRSLEFGKTEHVSGSFGVRSLKFEKMSHTAHSEYYKDHCKIDYSNWGNSIKAGLTHILIDKGKRDFGNDLKYSFETGKGNLELHNCKELASDVENTKLHTSHY